MRSVSGVRLAPGFLPLIGALFGKERRESLF